MERYNIKEIHRFVSGIMIIRNKNSLELNSIIIVNTVTYIIYKNACTSTN